MIGVPGMSSNRRIGKVEKPRPLKMSTLNDHSLESVLGEMDSVAKQLNASNYDPTSHNAIVSLCENLKMFGPQLEKLYKDQLDRFYVSIRNGCRSDSISLHTRYRLLEVLELRAMQWHANENHVTYFKQKLAQFEPEETVYEDHQHQQQVQQQPSELSGYMQTAAILATPAPAPLTSPIYPPHYTAAYPTQQILYAPAAQQAQPQIQHQPQQMVTPSATPGTPPTFAPGEVVKSSGKFVKPTRIPGKNYCKDEIVIRNADSGKVMGLKGRRVHMIEELSETIISFQRVAPGARERLVQITGPNEENISHARQLIEETIRRNASPVRSEENNSIFNNMGGSSSSISSHASDETLQGNKRTTLDNLPEEPLGEYRYTVVHQNDALRITGNNLDLVRTAKLILDEYFNSDQNLNHINLLSPDVDVSSSMSSSSFPSPPTTKVSQPSFIPPSKTSEGKKSPSEPEPPKNGVVTLLRQPLLPNSSKEIIENVEKEGPTAGSKDVSNRRALFAKTSDERASTSGEASGTPPPAPGFSPRLTYSRHFLIQCAASPFSRLTPALWSKVVRQHPQVVKKSWQHLPRLEAKMTEKGELSINSSQSYLLESDFVKPKDLLTQENKWTLFRSSSVIEEEDGN